MSDSALLNLPGEIILDILSCLDHGDICNLASSCRQMLHFAKDDRIWRSAHGRSFSKGRKLIELGQWRQDYSNRISALRELLVRGTNDFHAATARKLFTEMSSENEALLKTFLARSEISVQHLTVQCQGYVMSNVRSLLPAACLEVRPFENLHRRRIAAEPRSEVYLLRMLLARQTQQFMDVSNVEVFLRCAHLVAYNALEYPILFFPPGMIQHLRSQSRYELRSSNSMRSTVAQKPYEPTGVAGAVINWGVVETIYTLVRLYMDRMPEAIPNFVQPRDHYEPEVPMSAQMFDADLSGNWRGLYSYLDFRELEVLDSSRPFTPDFFDGMQNMKISAERPAESFSHAEKHGEENLGPNGLDVLQGLFASQSSATATDPSAVEAAQEVFYDRCRFTADGESIRGRFHIHGSTLSKYPSTATRQILMF